ncbi:MAG: antitoxin family protein [Methanomicrobiales archaeon]|nr:antitoxin family protein [Methanomicrobiales archaeon]
MIKTIRAHYTGSVFKPIDKVDLQEDIDVTISIIVDDSDKSEDLWDILDRNTGIVDGPPEWSSEHDHYIHGTPKKRNNGVTINL